MNHDRKFKELLTVFFVQFIDRFVPEVPKYLNVKSIVFLDKEVFSDVTTGTMKEVDVLVKARFKGKSTYFLIHIENESSAKKGFSLRFFHYYARLKEKYDLPIFPIVIYAYDKPRTKAPDFLDIEFQGQTVIHFQYKVIQLNLMEWQDFIDEPNPAAIALMTRMKIAPRDRPKVKLECMRLLMTLKLDAARTQLIGGFIEGYLALNAEETRRFELAFAKLDTQTKEATMEMWTSWGREGMEKGLQQGLQQGRQEGRQEGRQVIVTRQIRHRFGSVPQEVTDCLNRLTADQLDDLGEALFDFNALIDLETWLSRY